MAPEQNPALEKSFYENTGKYKGVAAWLMSTDHKRIGLMYLGALLSFSRWALCWASS